MGFSRGIILFLVISTAAACPSGYGLTASSAAATTSIADADQLPDVPSTHKAVTENSLPLAIVKEQISIWTSPIRTRLHDLVWLLPLGAATGVALQQIPAPGLVVFRIVEAIAGMQEWRRYALPASRL
jgi:hypothetical protein